MYLALVCESEQHLSHLVAELERQNIEFLVKEQGESKELWVADSRLVKGINDYYQAYHRSQQQVLNFRNLKLVPITCFILVFTLLSAFFTQLGSTQTHWFLMAKMQWDPRAWFYYEGPSAIWHSLSPVFLHFSLEHLIFNALSFWYLSNLIERATGKVFYLSLIITLALVGNFSQLWTSGPMFGGLSGVVYGLIGFAFVYQYRVANLSIPKGLFYLAGVWLLLGISGVFSAIGLFNMANAAHLGGLLSGVAMSFLYLVLIKFKRVVG